MKLIPKHDAKESTLQNAQREIEMCSKFNHPNVISMETHFENDSYIGKFIKKTYVFDLAYTYSSHFFQKLSNFENELQISYMNQTMCNCRFFKSVNEWC